jgi:hypothetical protein
MSKSWHSGNVEGNGELKELLLKEQIEYSRTELLNQFFVAKDLQFKITDMKNKATHYDQNIVINNNKEEMLKDERKYLLELNHLNHLRVQLDYHTKRVFGLKEKLYDLLIELEGVLNDTDVTVDNTFDTSVLSNISDGDYVQLHSRFYESITSIDDLKDICDIYESNNRYMYTVSHNYHDDKYHWMHSIDSQIFELSVNELASIKAFGMEEGLLYAQQTFHEDLSQFVKKAVHEEGFIDGDNSDWYDSKDEAYISEKLNQDFVSASTKKSSYHTNAVNDFNHFYNNGVRRLTDESDDFTTTNNEDEMMVDEDTPLDFNDNDNDGNEISIIHHEPEDNEQNSIRIPPPPPNRGTRLVNELADHNAVSTTDNYIISDINNESSNATGGINDPQLPRRNRRRESGDDKAIRLAIRRSIEDLEEDE